MGNSLGVTFGHDGGTARLVADAPPGHGVAAHARHARRELDGTHLVADAQGWSWGCPAAWLEPSA